MIVTRELDVDVLTAARQRIRNVFSNGLPVYLAFSGGKDSLVLADITAKMVQAGELDVSRLIVEFLDEEAIFPCVERIVHDWRKKFLLMGARFDWYCLEVKHFNCLNQLENDETFVCWDSRKADRWVRQPPPFAIRSHPNLPAAHIAKTLWHGRGKSNYQEFFPSICDGPRMTGLRVFESIQRRNAIAAQQGIDDLAARATVEPIYDWRDVDVWYYLLENDIEIPEAYLHLYQIGTNAKQLRISQFFSIDTAHALARMSEFYPNLMERILRREPSAYLVSLYWDSEMFRRRSRNRRAVEAKKDPAPPGEARAKVFAWLRGPFQSDGQKKVADFCRRVILQKPYIEDKHYELMYDALIAGDPKLRTFRGIVQSIEAAAAKAFVPGHKVFNIRAAESI